jgi:hypothetical protein
MVLTVNPAITYGVFERVKSLILLARQGNTKLSPWLSFIIGAISKTLATVVSLSYYNRLVSPLTWIPGHIPIYHGQSEDTSAKCRR